MEKCYICTKSFNFRKKHICKFCMNAACSDHCQRTKAKEGYEGLLSICDLCYKEEINKELALEIQLDIQSLEEELKQAKLINNRLEREHFEKTASLSKSENDLDDMSKVYEQKIKVLEYQITAEEINTQGISELYKNAKRNLELAQIEDVQAFEKLTKSQEDIEKIKKDKESLRDTNQGLENQLERINEKLKGSLNAEQVCKVLCPACEAKVSETSRFRNENPSILEDGTISLNAVEDRQSIIESVREYKDILAHQNNSPNEPSNCLII